MANGTLAASQLEMLSQDGTGIITITPPATNTDRTLTLPDGAGTVATAESTLAQFSASGSAPVFAARAWVSFNGIGAVAILASGNVSSITDNGTGDYTVNFTTAMPDENYSVAAFSAKGSTGDSNGQIISSVDTQTPRTSSLIRITNRTTAGSKLDQNGISLTVFR